MRASFVRTLVVVVGTAALGACHTYRPVTAPTPGSTVRVHVPVTSALSRVPETAAVEGVLVSMSDTITLATQTRREFGAFRELVRTDTVRLASSQASLLEVREFSRPRSVLLGVVVAGGAAYLAAVGFGFGGGGDPPDPPTEPQTSVVVSRSLVSSLVGLIFR